MPHIPPAAILVLAVAAHPLPSQAESEIPDDTEIRTTASGLAYSILAPGDGGARPRFGDKVKVHYTGWLENGEEFDSSRRREEAAEFVLGRVIEGWNEGLQLMTKGARFKLTIPADIAYGDRGRPPVIPPKSTLIFDVELLSFEEMPRLTKSPAEAWKTTESGVKYEVLVEGEGERPDEQSIVELEFALWNADGELLTCTQHEGQTIGGPVAGLKFAFLREMVAQMRVGGRLRLEVPPALAFGSQDRGKHLPADSTTHWEIALSRIIEPPEFSPLDPDATDRTESGLEYEVLREGEGATPLATSHVIVHYTGWLTNGTKFDSSYDRGRPASFAVGRVIPGWTEGLQLMKVGSVYRFRIPAELAYGARGAPPRIGPNEPLIFQVELIEIR